MSTLRHAGRALLCGALIAAAALPAHAVTRTSTLPVTATVTSACNLSTATMDFGSYTAGATANLDVAGSIRYTQCFGLTMSLELGVGANASGSTRRMRSPAGAFLSYEIYKNSGRTNILGTGAAALPVTAAAGGSANVPIYGRIPSGQAVAPGDYTDTVAITLTF